MGDVLAESFQQQRECPAPVLIYPEQQGSLARPLTITQWDGGVQLIVLLIDNSRPEEFNSMGFANFFFFFFFFQQITFMEDLHVAGIFRPFPPPLPPQLPLGLIQLAAVDVQ